MRGSRAPSLTALLVLFGGAISGSPRNVVAGEEEEARTRRLLDVATAARASVLPVQIHMRGDPPRDVDRNAVVADAEGWLVMAGPIPGTRDVVVVTLPSGEQVRASVAASDHETALTLLHLVQAADMKPLPFRGAGAGPGPIRPVRLPPGTRVAMVTGTGAVALGSVRARCRTVPLPDPSHGDVPETSSLTEAALAVVATDLGSPWLDEEGRVVGLLVAGGAEAPSAEQAAPSGISLRVEPVAAHAVPGHVAAIVWPLLKSQGRVPRARLGVRDGPVSEAVATHLCDGCGGRVIREVDPAGPAFRAGMRPDDILVALEGMPLECGATLPDLLLPYRPADTVKVRVVRLGKPIDLEVLLGERERER